MRTEVEGLDLDALEKVARAATGLTQGWRAEGYVIFGDWYASGAIASVRSGPKAFSDARHIATFDPPTVLRLLAALRAQDERVRVLEGAWAWIDKHDLELTFDYPDEEGAEGEWRVYRISGNINDREWDVIGVGETPLAAVLAARALLPATQAEES